MMDTETRPVVHGAESNNSGSECDDGTPAASVPFDSVAVKAWNEPNTEPEHSESLQPLVTPTVLNDSDASIGFADEDDADNGSAQPNGVVDAVACKGHEGIAAIDGELFLLSSAHEKAKLFKATYR